MYCVIMAGGSGTRFWPYSRHRRPKQLLKIVGDTSMLQMTVDRLKKINTVQDIFIVELRLEDNMLYAKDEKDNIHIKDNYLTFMEGVADLTYDNLNSAIDYLKTITLT